MQQRLATGIDQSKTLAEVAKEAGIEKRKLEQQQSQPVPTQKQVSQLFDSKSTTKMVMPKVDLPAELRKGTGNSSVPSSLGSNVSCDL